MKLESPFFKIEKNLSLSEKIEQQILDAIRQKIFLPGDKLLGEMELAESFGVSRTVVREALHRLAGRGIVATKKGYGVYVAENQYSPVANSLYHLLEVKCGNSSLLNIAEVRLIIEPESSRLAAINASDADIDHIGQIYQQMINNADNPKAMIKHDIDFHKAIAISSKNPILPVIMEPIFQLMYNFISDTYEYPHSPSLALQWHKKILMCIYDKNGEGAFANMKEHLSEAKDHASKILQNEQKQPKM